MYICRCEISKSVKERVESEESRCERLRDLREEVGIKVPKPSMKIVQARQGFLQFQHLWCLGQAIGVTYNQMRPRLLMQPNSMMPMPENPQMALYFVVVFVKGFCAPCVAAAPVFGHQPGVKVVVAYGGALGFNHLRSFERGVDILVATLGRLTDMIERSKISLKKIKYLALNEAGRMLDMTDLP
ncbi:DEAD-box ATP-dependent RNA helicase 52C-like protein [Tanacetum coccineum]